MTKLEQLIDNEGYETLESFLEDFALDSVVPGICMNDGCEYTTNVEPDQDKGWCENCNTNSVKSGLVLAGII